MRSPLETVPFESLVALKIDNRGKTPPLVPAGFPVLEIKSISRNSLYPIVSNADKFVDQETWDAWFRQHLQENDILFTTVGTIAESAIVPKNPNFAVAQNILGFRFDTTKVYPMYMMYLMRSHWFINQISGRTIETVQKSIKWSDIRGIEMPLPSIEVQKKIADYALSLDQKIELNRAMNKTLEDMGQALFKHYFIDNPEREGWGFIKISDLCNVQFGFAFKSSQFNETGDGVKIVRIRNILEGDSHSYTTETIDGAYQLQNGDLLVGMDGEFHVGYWFGGDAYLVQRVARFRARSGFSNSFIKQVLRVPISRLNGRGAKTTVAHLGSKDISEISLQFDEKIYQYLHTTYSALFNEQVRLNKEIKIISALRDSLLPRLMSGKIEL